MIIEHRSFGALMVIEQCRLGAMIIEQRIIVCIRISEQVGFLCDDNNN